MDHFARHQDGSFAAGDGGGGDHHVLFLDHRGHLLALAANFFFGEGAGVAALAFAAGTDGDADEFRAQAFDLFLDGGADVVAADDGAQAARGGDGLQSGDARADDQNARGRNGSGGGGHHRETGAAA